MNIDVEVDPAFVGENNAWGCNLECWLCRQKVTQKDADKRKLYWLRDSKRFYIHKKCVERVNLFIGDTNEDMITIDGHTVGHLDAARENWHKFMETEI